VETYSSAAAGALALAVFEAVRNLEQFPRLGRRVDDPRGEEIRELIVAGYHVGYRVRNDFVDILSIYHGAMRRPPDV